MFEMSVAFRFLREGRAQTAMIIVGIAVGIAVQVFLAALIGGLQKDLVSKTVGTAPHITATAPERQLVSLLPDSLAVVSLSAGTTQNPRPIRAWEPIVAQLRDAGWFNVVSPVVEGAAFAVKGERTSPVVVRGIDLPRADSIYQIRRRIAGGEAALGADGVLVGVELARDLRLKQGSTLVVSSSVGSSDVFTVRGIFDLETKAVNVTWVLMDLRRAQALLGSDGGISGVEMQVARVFEAQTLTEALRERFPALSWTSWQENNANLLAALKSQSGSSNLIQVLVILAVTLGVSSVLAVSAIQKSRQIGILKAIGMTRGAIGRVFFIMGATLGLIGSAFGCVAGYGLIVAFLEATAASTGKPLFPLSIEPSLYAASVAIATVAGMVAAFVPARRAARLQPIEVIRNG